MSTFIFRDLALEVEKETIDNILSLSQKDFSLLYTFLLKYFIDCHENLLTQFSNLVDNVLQKRKKNTSLHWLEDKMANIRIRGHHEMYLMHSNELIVWFSLFLSSKDDVWECVYICVLFFLFGLLDINGTLCCPLPRHPDPVSGHWNGDNDTGRGGAITHPWVSSSGRDQPQGSTDLRLKWSSI